MTSLFISDLHLEKSRPAVTRAFLHFLEETAAQADTLYILGDLFEAWVGDDDDAELASTVIAALRRLTDKGTALFVMHGNRDFLLGGRFARRTRARLLDDPAVVNLNGEPTLLLHGDSLCTRDKAYQQLRRQLRSDEWQQQVLSQPLAVRRQMAQQLRSTSAEANSNKAEDIMDVTPAEVVAKLREYGCRRMIHGHTHRPAVHRLDVDDEPAERIVLGDWDSRLWYVRCDRGGCALESRDIH